MVALAALAVLVVSDPPALSIEDRDGATIVRVVAGAPPRMHASVGQLGAVTRADARTFVARYTPPAPRYPQVAIIAAEVAGACGYTTLALPAPATPGVRTRPGAAVTLTVAGRSFGPATAGADGVARVPIEVPPGVRTAEARVVDDAGLASERTIDLAPPPFPRLVLLAPPVVAAGALAEVAVIAIEPDGRAVDDARLVLRSSYQRPHPLGARAGVARFLVRVPPRLDAGPLRLSAHLKPGAGPVADEADFEASTSAVVAVEPGPLARLTLTPRHSRLVVSGTDLFGHAVPVDGVEIFVDGRPARVEPADGLGRAVVVSASVDPARPVEVEAVAHGVYASYRLPAAEAPPARGAASAAAGLVWNRGPGYGLTARADLEAGEGLVALPAGLRPGLAAGYLHVATRADEGTERARVSLDEALFLARLSLRRPVFARVELGAALGAGLAFTRVASQAARIHLVGHHTGPAFEAAGEASGPAGPGALALALRYVGVPLGRLPSGDVVEGSGGGLVFDVGYRVGF